MRDTVDHQSYRTVPYNYTVLYQSYRTVLHAYRPGPLGGQAVAEALTGLLVPAGRLPFTYPKNAGDTPYPYHHKPGNQCVDPKTGAYIQCQVSQSVQSVQFS